MPSHTKSERLKNRMFAEVFNNPPGVVEKTKKKKGEEAAEDQKIAIALAKIRAAEKSKKRKK